MLSLLNDLGFANWRFVISTVDHIATIKKPTYASTILSVGSSDANIGIANVPADATSAKIVRVLPIGSSSTQTDIAITLSTYSQYDNLKYGYVNGSASVGSDTLISLARSKSVLVVIQYSYS